MTTLFSTLIARRLFLGLLLGILSASAQAQENSAITGTWVINTELSDNTDKQVEQALRAMGQKIDRCWLRCEQDRYRGGPAEQELYDHISYDLTLTILWRETSYQFIYDDNYQRQVYTDGRSQSVSLAALDEVDDFSFAHWEGDKLLVEARPRDGGFANETFTMLEAGMRLRVEMYIQPRAFSEAVKIVRYYERSIENTPATNN